MLVLLQVWWNTLLKAHASSAINYCTTVLTRAGQRSLDIQAFAMDPIAAAAAAAAQAQAQEPAVPAAAGGVPVFALTPALMNQQFLNYALTNNIKLYYKNIAPSLL